MNVTIKQIEQYAKEMLSEMDKYFESTEKFSKIFEEGRESISPENISYCLDKYLQAEFDYSTPGNRGLGRMSDHWPRLAAYFRSAFSKLDAEGVNKLEAQITTLIVKSYLFAIIISDKPAEKPRYTGEQMFEKWIPKIYTFELSTMSEKARNMLFAIVQNDYEGIKSFFIEHGMKPGFFGGDKTDDILTGYVAAGLVMRLVEKS